MQKCHKEPPATFQETSQIFLDKQDKKSQIILLTVGSNSVPI